MDKPSTLDGKLHCLQSLLQQLGANTACSAVSEARDLLNDANLAQRGEQMEQQVVVHWPRRAGRTTEQLMALQAALQLYPQQNTQLLQARKVCAGVAALADKLLAERAKEVSHG
ncbi:MAG: hypothetical protein ACTHJ9_05285 [Rhodanobacter sp.]